ncbi:MAG: polyphosphate kinase 1 [Treponema sp.]|nr:polyphosphate kinase 1 [Treponema sp.]
MREPTGFSSKSNAAYSSQPASRFINRDLSWLDFNRRVLEEGLRRDLLPLDRFRFFSIVSSNFDEFFMVRVAAMKRTLGALPGEDPSGLSPEEQLKSVSQKVRSIIERQYSALNDEVLPDLASGGLTLLRPSSWSKTQREYLASLFQGEILPILTPLRIDENDTLPAMDSSWVHAAFLLENENNEEKISVVRIPNSLDRIVWLENENESGSSWALLEDLVLSWGGALYPGYKIKESLLFKINRDADFSVDERRDEDFVEAMEELLETREHSGAVRMVYSSGSARLTQYLARRFGLEDTDLYEINGPLNPESLYDLVTVKGFDHLREKPWKFYDAPGGDRFFSIWDRIRAGDFILHFPYQSFEPVIRFFQDAASDPDVVAIKATLYRISGGGGAAIPPVVRALKQASLAGKHVTAVVELKARFDEEQNISWAKELEKAGVIVVYGLARLKVHAKVALVMRKENGRMRRYVHLSTGNYNDRTARLYEDICLFTDDDEIAFDTGLLFNMITGYSEVSKMRRLSIAPTALKRKLLDLIDREIRFSSPESPGRIMAKMNSLADIDIINALYRASAAAVRVDLNVRGICMLVPGVKGLSENIRVVSVIDHYLEHARIIYFASGGGGELYLSSADWMPRNLERRVELMFPVLEEEPKRLVLLILQDYFKDTCHSWILRPDGVWERIKSAAGETPFRAQTGFLAKAAKAAERHEAARTEFIVRRSPIAEGQGEEKSNASS